MTAPLALQVRSPGLPFATFALKAGMLIVGRSRECDLVVKHTTVSRRHAEIVVKDKAITVQDLGSLNGTYVNNQRICRCCVQWGQMLRFGAVAFLVADQGSEGSEPASDLPTDHCDAGGQTLDLDTAKLRLSKAQSRVFTLLLQGLSEKEIGQQLHLSPCTVHNHVQVIHRVLGVHSGKELLAQFLDRNTRGSGSR